MMRTRKISLVLFLALLAFTVWMQCYSTFISIPTAWQITAAQLRYVALLSAFAGLLAFRGADRFAWVVFALLLGWLGLREPSFVGNNTETMRLRYAILSGCFLSLPLLHLWVRRAPEFLRLLVFLIISVPLLQSAVTLGQFLLLQTGAVNWADGWSLGFFVSYARDSQGVYGNAPRLRGLVSSPNVLGMVLVCFWPMLCLLANEFQTRRGRLFVGSLFCMMALAAAMTYSRAAYLGVACQAAVVGAVWLWRRLRSGERVGLPWGVVVFFVMFAVCVVLLPHGTARAAALADSADFSIRNRLTVWLCGLNFLSERPLCGWGPGVFCTYYSRLCRIWHESYPFMDLHSAVINTLVEVGAAGCLLAWAALVGFPRRLPLVAVLVLVGMGITMLSENSSNYACMVLPALYWLAWLRGKKAESERIAPTPHRPVWQYAAVAVAGALWLFGWTRPVPTLEQLYTERLSALVKPCGAKAAYLVMDLKSGKEWAYRADEPIEGTGFELLGMTALALKSDWTSGPAELLTVEGTDCVAVTSLRSGLMTSETSTTVLGDVIRGTLAQDYTAANVLTRRLEAQRPGTVSDLLRAHYVPWSEATDFDRLTGGSGDGGGNAKRDWAPPDGAVDRTRGYFTGSQGSASLRFSVREAAGLMRDIMQTTGSAVGDAAREAMSVPDIRRAGLARYIDPGLTTAEGDVMVFRGAWDKQRAEVMARTKNGRTVVIAVAWPVNRLTGSIADLSNALPAEIGWMSELYFFGGVD